MRAMPPKCRERRRRAALLWRPSRNVTHPIFQRNKSESGSPTNRYASVRSRLPRDSAARSLGVLAPHRPLRPGRRVRVCRLTGKPGQSQSLGLLFAQGRFTIDDLAGRPGSGVLLRSDGGRLGLEYSLRHFRVSHVRVSSHEKKKGRDLPDLSHCAPWTMPVHPWLKASAIDFAACKFSAALLPLRLSFTRSKLSFWASTRNACPHPRLSALPIHNPRPIPQKASWSHA